jgi:hypothetical protein
MVTASCTLRRGTVAAGPIPVSTLRRPRRRALGQGTFLRVADLRFRSAYRSVAVRRSTMPRRGVPTREPGRHQRRSSPHRPNAP